MRKCEDCKLVLDDDVRFCPNCGAGVAAEQRARQPMSPEVGVLLTSANLHRINREWDDALADASQALQMDPNNAEVASLLASVYEGRGDLDEAAVWYKIAVEFRPDNAAYRAKLDRIDELIVRRSGGRRAGPRKRAWAWAGGAALVAVVLIAVILAMLGGRRAPESVVGKPDQARNETPRARITSPVAPAGATRPAQPRLAGGQTGGSTELRTAAELAIRRSAGEVEAVQSYGARVDDVIADPRQGVVVATFSIPGGGTLSRDRILLAAAGIARAALAANSEVKYVTARCLISTGAPAGAQIAFVGDTARASIEALPDSPTREQLEALFANQWWNPQIRQ